MTATTSSRMKEEAIIHWKDKMSDSTRSVSGRATETAIATKVSADWTTQYWALSAGSIDQMHVTAHHRTNMLIVVGKRRSSSERPELRKRTTKAARRMSIGTREPMSPKMPRIPLPANPTKNMPATV